MNRTGPARFLLTSRAATIAGDRVAVVALLGASCEHDAVTAAGDAARQGAARRAVGLDFAVGIAAVTDVVVAVVARLAKLLGAVVVARARDRHEKRGAFHHARGATTVRVLQVRVVALLVRVDHAVAAAGAVATAGVSSSLKSSTAFESSRTGPRGRHPYRSIRRRIRSQRSRRATRYH